MDRLPEGVKSRFRYVLLVSKRAEQLIQGSMPKIQTRDKKPTKIARMELIEGAFSWQLTPPPPDEAVAAVFGDASTEDEQ
jgi:DNA-directed RNA polymerase subunit K/omega